MYRSGPPEVFWSIPRPSTRTSAVLDRHDSVCGTRREDCAESTRRDFILSISTGVFIMTPVSLQFRRLSPHATLPTYATPQSACMDISACLPVGTTVTVYNTKNETTTKTLTEPKIIIYPGDRYLIPTGWAVQCPDGQSLRLYSRSGLSLKQGLMLVNGVGIIDEDYRHEVCVLFMNMSRCSAEITHGMRICQGELVSSLGHRGTTITEVTTTDEAWFITQRTGGFGSTGV